jgi:hypothetical protein
LEKLNENNASKDEEGKEDNEGKEGDDQEESEEGKDEEGDAESEEGGEEVEPEAEAEADAGGAEEAEPEPEPEPEPEAVTAEEEVTPTEHDNTSAPTPEEIEEVGAESKGTDYKAYIIKRFQFPKSVEIALVNFMGWGTGNDELMAIKDPRILVRKDNMKEGPRQHKINDTTKEDVAKLYTKEQITFWAGKAEELSKELSEEIDRQAQSAATAAIAIARTIARTRFS